MPRRSRQARPAGRGTADHIKLDPPLFPLRYQPRFLGVRPAYGLFLRYARDVTIAASSMRVAAGAKEGRPAIVMDEVQGMRMTQVELGNEGAAGASCQLAARNSSGDWLNDVGTLRSCAWHPEPREADRRRA